jgi:hypothetical protein
MNVDTELEEIRVSVFPAAVNSRLSTASLESLVHCGVSASEAWLAVKL